MTTTERTAKDIAADLRSALRKATKTEGHPLEGLTVSVRKSEASMCTEIGVTVTGLDKADMLIEREEGDYDSDIWTERAHLIADSISDMADEANAWHDGSMRFFFTYFDGGLCMPNPRMALQRPGAAEEIAAEVDERHAEVIDIGNEMIMAFGDADWADDRDPGNRRVEIGNHQGGYRGNAEIIPAKSIGGRTVAAMVDVNLRMTPEDARAVAELLKARATGGGQDALPI